jgi:hypothetical protein
LGKNVPGTRSDITKSSDDQADLKGQKESTEQGNDDLQNDTDIDLHV